MGFLVYFIIIMALPIVVQIYLKKTYKKYMDVGASSGLTGAEAARQILDENGLYHVAVEHVRGTLSDHYDPRDKTVRLSTDNYYGTSIAALSVGIHEVGHAIQDQEDYGPLRLRHSLVPVANFGSSMSFIVILAGILLSSANLLLVGIFLDGRSCIVSGCHITR